MTKSKSIPVSFSMTKKQIKKIDRLAKAKGMTRSAYIRWLLNSFADAVTKIV